MPDFGARQETNSEGVAWDTMIYSIPEVERITRVAAQIALAADPPLAIHSIDKANVLASSRSVSFASRLCHLSLIPFVIQISTTLIFCVSVH
jgi:isocitrate/isopropylmalate dehydrogenase